jgi:DNA-directed RNA polymerase specialized sigma24 family protein
MYVDDLTAEQVAATIGCSAGAVKSHLHRAKRHLATMVEDGESGERGERGEHDG